MSLSPSTWKAGYSSLLDLCWVSECQGGEKGRQQDVIQQQEVLSPNHWPAINMGSCPTWLQKFEIQPLLEDSLIVCLRQMSKAIFKVGKLSSDELHPLLIASLWVRTGFSELMFASSLLRGLHASLVVIQPRKRKLVPSQLAYSRHSPWAVFLSAVFLLHDFQLTNTEPVLKRPQQHLAV